VPDQKAFVTGGAGFLGRRVVTRLLRDGWHGRCLVRSRVAAAELTRSLDPSGAQLECVHGSLMDQSAIREGLSGCDRVFHLAAGMKGPASSLFLDSVVSTRTLLSLVREVPLQRFFLVSSIAVYETYRRKRHSLIDERCAIDAQPEFRDPYTYSKIAQEQLCWKAVDEHGLPLVVVRPGVIYGPTRPAMLSRVGPAVGRNVIKVGGRHRLPCTYVENCADAVYKAGIVEGIDGRAYNIVDADAPTGAEVIRAFRRHGARLRVLPVPALLWPLVGAAYEWYWHRSEGMVPPVLTRRRAALWKPLRYSDAAARQDLGWRPAIPTRDAIVETLGRAADATA
jgi:nucleoside-diphosphate-sugar epimerase